MSRAIQETLELPVLEDLLKSSFQEGAVDDGEELIEEEDEVVEVLEASTALSRPNAFAQEVMEARQAKDHEDSMDGLHEDTLQHAKDLMDLGYNIDTRSASKIFESAATMFKLAMEAKNSKREAQLKLHKLHIDRRKQELAERVAKGEKDADTVEGESVIVEDRNELIKRLRSESNK